MLGMGQRHFTWNGKLITSTKKNELSFSKTRYRYWLNDDSKIATKAIAKRARLEALLRKLVNPDQTGFIKGRYIGENIRLIIDAQHPRYPGILWAFRGIYIYFGCQ